MIDRGVILARRAGAPAGRDGAARDVAASDVAASDVEADVARTRSPDGPQRLKNHIEREIVARSIRGATLLDVGIGTGRIGLHLKQAGLELTGVDRSAAMLERCRAEAGQLPLTCVAADADAMPLPDASFDTVVSIDALSDPDAWQRSAAEFLRVAKPGGRIVFNAVSADHVHARPLGEVRRLDRPAKLVVLSLDDVRRFARAHGVRVAAIVPYGALLGGLAPNSWLSGGSPYAAEQLERLLSWMGTDEALLAFAAFLERHVVGALPARAAARLMVVIDRAPDDGETDLLIDGMLASDQALLAGELDLGEIAARHEGGPEVFRSELASLLSDARNRSFLSALARRLPVSLPARLVAQAPAAFGDEWERRERSAVAAGHLDRYLDAWRVISGGGLIFHGVDLGAALASEIRSELLGDQ